MKREFLKPLLDLFFPIACFGCSLPKNENVNPAGILCANCQKKIVLNRWVFCPICNKKDACQKHRTGLTWLGVATDYNQQILKSLIWEYKYGFNESFAEVFSEMIFQYFEKIRRENLPDENNFVLSFIPLTRARQRWRGFNQSKLLAKNLAAKINLPLIDALERTAYPRPQMSLETKKQRFENTKNSFSTKNPEKILGKNIILVDDVCATGATLHEAAKTLKRAGAKNVFGLVLARKL